MSRNSQWVLRSSTKGPGDDHRIKLRLDIIQLQVGPDFSECAGLSCDARSSCAAVPCSVFGSSYYRCRRVQTLPGKVEFEYLPENCQAVLMLPVLEASAVVVIGTNRARAFTPKDIAWMKGLCDQASLSLRLTAVA